MTSAGPTRRHPAVASGEPPRSFPARAGVAPPRPRRAAPLANASSRVPLAAWEARGTRGRRGAGRSRTGPSRAVPNGGAHRPTRALRVPPAPRWRRIVRSRTRDATRQTTAHAWQRRPISSRHSGVTSAPFGKRRTGVHPRPHPTCARPSGDWLRRLSCSQSAPASSSGRPPTSSLKRRERRTLGSITPPSTAPAGASDRDGTLPSAVLRRLARMEEWLSARAAADPTAEPAANLCLWIVNQLEGDGR